MFRTLITQYDEGFWPPDQPVLDVTVIADQVFLTISKYDEDHKTTTLTEVAQCAVGVDELLMALHSGVHADNVQRQRPKEKHRDSKNNPPADGGGESRTDG